MVLNVSHHVRVDGEPVPVYVDCNGVSRVETGAGTIIQRHERRVPLVLHASLRLLLSQGRRGDIERSGWRNGPIVSQADPAASMVNGRATTAE